MDLQQHLQQVKEDKAKQEQSTKIQPARTLQEYKQVLQEADNLWDKESFLGKTIELLLKPEESINNYVPQELQRKQQQQKKKRGRHL